jgi:penicillin-binding protein-related factor A (putative recombinase)
VPVPPLTKSKRSKYKRALGRRNAHRQGKSFEAEIKKSLEYCAKSLKKPIFWKRFYDTRDYIRLNPYLQVPHQPCDFWALYDGTAYFLEAKSSKSERSYRMSYVKDSQLDDLLALQACGARSYFLFCRRVPRHNRVFATPVQIYNALKEEAEDINKKSIPWATIRDVSTEIPLIKGKGKTWDLRYLF